MSDLISRAAAIEAAVDGADDWDGGYNPERERYIMEYVAKVPAVDAIPVEWLREKMLRPQMTDGNPFGFVLAEWQEEQEAR